MPYTLTIKHLTEKGWKSVHKSGLTRQYDAIKLFNVHVQLNLKPLHEQKAISITLSKDGKVYSKFQVL
jgi:hypothetical protein